MSNNYGTISPSDGGGGGSGSGSGNGKESQLINLYEDKSIATGETVKALTNVTNSQLAFYLHHPVAIAPARFAIVQLPALILLCLCSTAQSLFLHPRTPIANKYPAATTLSNNYGTISLSDGDGSGGSGSSNGNGKESQLIDLYEDKSIATGETVKALTNIANSHAPQTGVHLYQFPASFYSCEARLMLEEKGIKYKEHDVCIVSGVFDQYEPDYVRINPRCVVPTLVVDGKVTSDAHNIVLHADEAFPDTVGLFPDDESKESVKEQFELACEVFVEALTYGEVEGGPKLPWAMRGMMKSNHGKKFKALTEKLEEHKSDPYLRACYQSKLNILTKQIEILNDDKQLVDIVAATKVIMEKLNKQLIEGPPKDGVSWLCGKDYTIADMQWGLNLVRLKIRLYNELLWGEYPAIESYCQRLMARPAIQKAVVKYQSMPVVGGLILRRKLAKNGKKLVLTALGAAILGFAGYALLGHPKEL